MTGGISTEVIPTLENFSPHEWDSLLPESGFYGSYSWLRAVRRHEEFSVSYFTARDDHGRLLAALPVYRAAAPPSERQFDPSAIFGTAGDQGFYPAAVVGVRAGYSTCFPCNPAAATSTGADAMRALLGRCMREAREEGCRSLSLLYLPANAFAKVREALPQNARVIPAGSDAILGMKWESFEEYQEEWPRNRRRGIERDISSFRKSGCSISRGRFAECYEEMVPLLAALQARYGALDSPRIIRRRLAEQAALLDERAVCFLCRNSTATVGFSLFYVWEDELYARVVGFDYEALPEDSRAYFSVLFYEPIRFAAGTKIRAIHYGRGTAEAKARRGASLEPRWSVFIDLTNKETGEVP